MKEYEKHGLFGTKEFYTFYSMKKRCENKNHICFNRYGGRGIKMKFKTLKSFIDEVGFAPTEKHTIERIDNDGNYEPGNVRWATYKEQANNTSRNNRVTINGKTRTVKDWAKYIGIEESSFRFRCSNWNKNKLLAPKQEKGHGIYGINIYFIQDENKYRARVRIKTNGGKRKEVYIGRFDSYKEALLNCKKYLNE